MHQINGQASKSAPARFLVVLGGFAGPRYEAQWSRDKLRYRSNDSQVSVVPSAADWKTFWTAVDKIGIWGWEPRYDNLEIMDGCQWEIDLSDGSRTVRCYGSNAYPGGRDLEHARPFQQFLEAVGTLVGQPFGRGA